MLSHNCSMSGRDLFEAFTFPEMTKECLSFEKKKQNTCNAIKSSAGCKEGWKQPNDDENE